MRTKVVVGLMLAAVALYCALLGQRAWLLATSGSAVGVALGVGVAVVPVLVMWAVLREVRFGRQTEVMARELDAEGGLPVDDLPRTPGGRIDRSQTGPTFERYRDEAEAAPDDWRSWFRLGCAYDVSGDRRRARAAMRHAASLHRAV